MFYNCIESKKHQRGYIIHQIVNPDGGGVSWTNYGQIVGGLAWPSVEAPGYFCILGEELIFPKDSRDQARGKVRLLAEADFESISLDRMFSIISDDAVRLGCDVIYTDIADNLDDFCQSFMDYTYSHEVNHLRLDAAPYGGIPMVGVAIVQDWIKIGLLEIPADSSIYRQLKSLGKMNLDTSLQAQFNAVTGLRYAIGSIHRNRPHVRRRRSSRRRNAMIV